MFAPSILQRACPLIAGTLLLGSACTRELTGPAYIEYSVVGTLVQQTIVGGSVTLEVAAQVQDAQGAAVPRASVRFQATSGHVTPWQAMTDSVGGPLAVRWTVVNASASLQACASNTPRRCTPYRTIYRVWR